MNIKLSPPLIIFLGLTLLVAISCQWLGKPPLKAGETVTLSSSPTLVPGDPETQSAQGHQTPLAVVNTASGDPVKIFLIAVDDNGASGPRIGCNDSVIGVEVAVDGGSGPLSAAIEKLLSIHTEHYGGSGLYNALWHSNLTLEKAVIEDGEAVIRLRGQLVQGGTCDAPRIKAQLEETASQFPHVRKVTVFVNGQKLDELLSGQG